MRIALMTALCLVGCTGEPINLGNNGGALTCGDGTQNGDESDVNCGGAHCSPCTGGKHCNTGTDCASNTCLAQACCGLHQADCDQDPHNGCEVDLASDNANCGACGVACAAGTSCQSGSCQPDHSGCGNGCHLPNATSQCVNGACAVTSCNAGFGDCDAAPANGCEVSLDTDANNCGHCGSGCSAGVHQQASCVHGACGNACDNGFGDCNGSPHDGCETQLTSDNNNCGHCGNVCPAGDTCQAGVCTTPTCHCSLPNATSACMNNVCAIHSCNAGFGDCNQDPNDGCEAALTTDLNNCGACGQVCAGPHGATCVAGVCTTAGGCDAFGFCDCDLNPANGNETNVSNDPNNCGACGLVCSLNNVPQPTCSQSICNGACAAGYADCNHDRATDGCETSTSNDPLNCGGCGQVCAAGEICHNGNCAAAPCSCSPQNGTGQCVNNVCTIASCNAGFGDCNQNANDGCEVNLGSDSFNCGHCGVVCAAGKTCHAGVCQ